MKFQIQPQTVVRHTKSGRKGVVTTDLPGMLSCNSPEESTVVFEGTTYGEGTITAELEILGPENAIADPKKCGSGQGADCCIFLTCGPTGFACDRFSSLRWNLIFREMSAKRDPAEPFPLCQNGESSPRCTEAA